MILFHLFDNSRFSRINPSILYAEPDNQNGGGGPTLTSFKSTRVETREDLNTTISGPSSARQRSTIYLAFRWRADDAPTLKAGFVILFRGYGPVLLGNYIFL